MSALLRHDLPAFDLEQQAIQRRRKMNEERNKRIFDPKVRTIGIDYDALDTQIREKEGQKQMERERNMEYGMLYCSPDIAVILMRPSQL